MHMTGLVRANRNLDSMEIWLEKFPRTKPYRTCTPYAGNFGGNATAKITFLRHEPFTNRGLRLAIELADTLEIADSPNNIGTDLRRMECSPEAANSIIGLHIAGKYTGNRNASKPQELCLCIEWYRQHLQNTRQPQ